MISTPTAADAARVALERHSLDLHPRAVEALATELGELSKSLDRPPTAEELEAALDRLADRLNRQRKTPIRNLGAFLGSAHRNAEVRRDGARTWLEAALDDELPAPPPSADALSISERPPSTEAELGRVLFQLHHLEAALEALADLFDAETRTRSNSLAEVRDRLRRVSKARSPFAP